MNGFNRDEIKFGETLASEGTTTKTFAPATYDCSQCLEDLKSSDYESTAGNTENESLPKTSFRGFEGELSKFLNDSERSLTWNLPCGESNESVSMAIQNPSSAMESSEKSSAMNLYREQGAQVEKELISSGSRNTLPLLRSCSPFGFENYTQPVPASCFESTSFIAPSSLHNTSHSSQHHQATIPGAYDHLRYNSSGFSEKHRDRLSHFLHGESRGSASDGAFKIVPAPEFSGPSCTNYQNPAMPNCTQRTDGIVEDDDLAAAAAAAAFQAARQQDLNRTKNLKSVTTSIDTDLCISQMSISSITGTFEMTDTRNSLASRGLENIVDDSRDSYRLLKELIDND